MFHWQKVVSVNLWQDNMVLDWLNSGVIVVLVHLPVNSLSCNFMSVWLDSLPCHSWLDNLFDVGVVTIS